jgi:hypothetical protein
MTREEREEYVIQLYKQNNSIREIARLVHMSFRDIGVIINKAKLQAERERGYVTVDTEPKSKESQAFKLFSEGKSPVQVAIALDLDAGRVRAIYYDYWELKGMYKLAEIYIELGRDDLLSLIRLQKIFKHLGMKQRDMFKVLQLAKHNQLELQAKVEYLENQIFVLEDQKTKATNDILKLNKMIDEFQSSLPQNGGRYDNTNLYPTYIEPDISSYSIELSYSDYWSWR